MTQTDPLVRTNTFSGIDGEWTIRTTSDYVYWSNEHPEIDGYLVREVCTRFRCCGGKLFLDIRGVLRWLDHHGWPPLPAPAEMGSLGRLMTDMLPPAALCPMWESLRAVELWRLDDVRQWREDGINPA